MKKATLFLSLALGMASVSLAQVASPTPPVGDDVVKISTNLIQVDVTVTDKDGKTVRGLTKDDFELFENGEKQDLSDFLFVTSSSGGITLSGGEQAAPAGGVQGQLPQTPLKPGQVRRTIAIVVDDLNMSYESMVMAKKALRKFVEEQMLPNDLVAIIRTGGSVGALQQFTSDKRVLMAGVESLRWNPLGTAGMAAIQALENSPEDITERTNMNNGYFVGALKDDMTARISGRKRPRESRDKAVYQNSRSFEETVEGINSMNSLSVVDYVIKGMSELPGRKALMLFSDGLRISGSATGRAESTRAYLEKVIETANRSSVVVYTFDTKGLKPIGLQAMDTSNEVIEHKRDQKTAERLIYLQGSQDGLTFFAGETGGKALINSNNLTGGIERALEEQSGFYLLAYLPDAETFDPSARKFNKLEVKVKRPGLKVSYRSGFFNTAGNTVPTAANVVADAQLGKALTSPFARNEIALNVNALYADDEKDGPYIRSFVHINASQLKFTTDAEGWNKATFDIAAATFGDNGMPVEKTETKYTIRSKGPTHDAIMKNGFVYVLILPVKKTGVYQYRVALRDSETSKIGAASQIVEIPDLADRKLALSGVVVEDMSLATFQNISQGKVGNNPGQVKVPSTLLYDTVMKEFRAGTVLRYGYEVYNARGDASQAPEVETQAKIIHNNSVVVQGNVMKFNPAGQPDLKRLKVMGNMMLKETLKPGDYVLQVVVRDMRSKQVTTQLFPFEIVQ